MYAASSSKPASVALARNVPWRTHWVSVPRSLRRCSAATARPANVLPNRLPVAESPDWMLLPMPCSGIWCLLSLIVPWKSLNPLSGSADGGELVPASQPLCLFIGQFLGSLIVSWKSLNPLSGSADGGELVPASQPICLFIGQFVGRTLHSRPRPPPASQTPPAFVVKLQCLDIIDVILQ